MLIPEDISLDLHAIPAAIHENGLRTNLFATYGVHISNSSGNTALTAFLTAAKRNQIPPTNKLQHHDWLIIDPGHPVYK